MHLRNIPLPHLQIPDPADPAQVNAARAQLGKQPLPLTHPLPASKAIPLVLFGKIPDPHLP